MNKLIFANLLHRPVRSIISVLAVAIEVIMILSIVGIFMGMLNDRTAHQRHRRGPDGAPLQRQHMNGVGGAPMPVKNIEAIRAPAACGSGLAGDSTLTTAGKIEVLYGIDYASFNALKPFVFLPAGPSKDPTTSSWTTSLRARTATT